MPPLPSPFEILIMLHIRRLLLIESACPYLHCAVYPVSSPGHLRPVPAHGGGVWSGEHRGTHASGGQRAGEPGLCSC